MFSDEFGHAWNAECMDLIPVVWDPCNSHRSDLIIGTYTDIVE